MINLKARVFVILSIVQYIKQGRFRSFFLLKTHKHTFSVELNLMKIKCINTVFYIYLRKLV